MKATNKKYRRHFIRALFAMLLSWPFILRGAEASRKRPNILFIYTDQQNFGMLSSEGNPYIKTPNLDRLAREGVMFTNSYCTFPSCSPSRATVITGALAFNHRLYDNIREDNGIEGLKPSDGFPLTEESLQDAGYQIGNKGKWHIGNKGDWGKCFTQDPDYSEAYSPLWNKLYKNEVLKKYPWDPVTHTGAGGYVKGKTPEPTRLTPSWQAAFDKDNKKIPDWAIVGEMLLPPEQTPEFTIVDETINFITRNKDQVWMVTISLSPPHDPWSIPEPYYSQIAKPLMDKMKIEGNGKNQGKSLSYRVGKLVDDQGIKDYMAIYHAQVVMMDNFIGRVLDALDKLQLADDTLVIFTSDHGDMLGMHHNVGKINNNLYNRLYHVPCLIRYPAKIKGGQVITKPIMHTDFNPTILDYAGITPAKNIDGQSLRPLIDGNTEGWRDYHLLEKFMDTKRNEEHIITNKDSFYYAMGLEDGRYKYIYTRFNNPTMNQRYCGPRLIDLKNDSFEENNLFENPKYHDVVIQYHDRLRTALAEHRFPFLDEYPDDPWKVR